MKRPAYNALQNLIIAERVCNYVGQKMTKGATNKKIDLKHSWMRYQSQRRDFELRYSKLPNHLRARALLSVPDLQPRMLIEQREKDKRWLPNQFLYIMAKAFNAEQSGIGNCMEQAAVGFRYLCERTNCKLFTLAGVGPDHYLLVFGVGKDKLKGIYSFDKAPDWPEDAVICDPWYNEWFIVKKHWCLKMREILKAAEQLTQEERRSAITGVIPIRYTVQGPKPFQKRK